jgi:superfamily II DNA or RNA helicase
MFPKHKKFSYFFSRGLFNKLLSFSELENRISDLPEIDRGDAFEVFAEAYFNTQNIHQVQEVWPEKVLPEGLRQQLGVLTDAGVDGVFKTRAGLFNAYQVKFRSNRAALTWDSDGLGKFFGQTDRVHERILITNSNDLSHITNTRLDFYSVKGNDLDRLNDIDFKAIECWLKTGIVNREKKKPLLHQEEAINDILQEFSGANRATVIMACATGKTLVSLWVAEQMNAQTILVLIPSLALVRQILHDWAKENNWDSFNFLCVCSDQTVVNDEDETILRQYDLDFAVTTQKKEVEQFLLNENIKFKIVFSTYQSCQIVAQAMPHNFVFDLAIFDEAHKTASRKGANYSFALEDKNLSIKKRLFLTATPRHYNVSKKDKEGDRQVVFSMDDETTYGRIAHQLSFRSAVRKNLICDYKILISIVTSEMIGREELEQGELVVGGDVIKAQRVANIIAIQRAIEKYGIQRIFSFHSSVSAAKSFIAKTNEGIGAYLKDFATMHVNGEMSTSKRDSLLKEFKEANKAIISNARCLTEGVNIPAVDMVVFISPKKSRVDIVQSAGRAMRKYPGKECGYILLPLFVQIADGETLEQAIEKTKFDTVWDVLQAMQEQDESLVEVIAQLREDRGKALGINDNRLREHVEVLGPELFLNELRESITIKIIDRVGISWDERFGELVRFKGENGHCNIRRDYSNASLSMWVGTQRRDYKKGRIPVNRIKKMEEQGFIWDLKESLWFERYLEMQEFKKIHDHCNVPAPYYINPTLRCWLSTQRAQFKKNKIFPHRLKKLEELGITWERHGSIWEKQFKALCSYKERYDNCRVPEGYLDDPALARWVQTQRCLYRINDKRMTIDRITRLNEVGFEWEPIKDIWDNNLKQLCVYKESKGDCNVPLGYKENPSLGAWVSSIRNLYRKKDKRLSISQITKLNDIGFIWNPQETAWEVGFALLKKFKEENGSCYVKQKDKENKALVSWISSQRNAYKKNKLSSDRVLRLNAIGFIWESRINNRS